MKPQIKISDIVTPLDFKIHCMQLHPINKLAKNSYNTTIDFDVYLPTKNKNLQRDFVWTLEQKQSLIMSFFKGIRIPRLSLINFNDDSDSRFLKTILKIIDGKQRLSTFLDFYNNKFPIVVNGYEYYKNELSNEMQRTIDFYQFDVDITYEYFDDIISDEQKIAWFEMINFFGTKQDIIHMQSLKE